MIISAHCKIEVSAIGANVNVKLREDPPVLQSSSGAGRFCRGVHTFVVDPFSCSVLEARHFDTWGGCERRQPSQ